MKIINIVTGPYQTNVYILINDDNSTEKKPAAVIDPGGGAAEILGAIQKYNLDARYILLTHAHFDHTCAIDEVAEKTGAKLLMHESDAVMLADNENNGGSRIQIKNTIKTRPEFISNGEVITLGGLAIQVLHTPGHSPGSVCYIAGNVMFSGDTLFAGAIGRTDFPYSDHAKMLESLKKISSLTGEYTVYPGHDEKTTLSREKRYNHYL